MKYASNTGCLGAFLFFVVQIMLLVVCVFSGIGNSVYDKFLYKYVAELENINFPDTLHIVAFYLSIPLSIILILGIIVYLRYWIMSNRFAAQYIIINEGSLSEHDRARRKMFSVYKRIKNVMNTIVLMLSIIPAVYIIYTINFSEPGSNELIFITKVSFSAYAVFFMWLVLRFILEIAQALLAFYWLKDTRLTKEQILTSEMARIFGENCGYEPHGKFFADPFETKVIRKYYSYACNDHIFGTYKGIKFEQADILLQDITDHNKQLTDAVQTYVTSEQAHNLDGFKGRWIIVHQPKVASGKFYIISRNSYADELERFKIISGLSEVFLEDIEFNRNFMIYAESPHDVFYVMTPQFIERLKRFADMGKGQKDFSIRLGFYENRIHFIICGLADAFEHLYGVGSIDLSTTEESARISVRRDLSLITDFIESLFDIEED